jgi:hypothetical protein
LDKPGTVSVLVAQVKENEMGVMSLPMTDTLPEHLRELFMQSTQWIGHIPDADMIWGLLQDYRDVFVALGGALGVGRCMQASLDRH